MIDDAGQSYMYLACGMGHEESYKCTQKLTCIL